MEDIVIFAKKTKLAGMAIGCLVFEAFFIHFFINGLPEAQAPFKSFVPAASFIGSSVQCCLNLHMLSTVETQPCRGY